LGAGDARGAEVGEHTATVLGVALAFDPASTRETVEKTCRGAEGDAQIVCYGGDVAGSGEQVLESQALCDGDIAATDGFTLQNFEAS